ncbi:HD domain-containing protein [Fonticella tunisiensis]|uniref:HD domain-containing protein n=2 Tax=Fonticella tunisiensis TaxID=1096341 RepID=A0A4R7KSH9_9CLOT|nr:HD domain-containing protein [Fonticella tunisiensis]
MQQMQSKDNKASYNEWHRKIKRHGTFIFYFRFKLIKILLLLMRQKDEYTYTHSIRVMRLAYGYAKYYDLPGHEIKILKYASLLHDIGKLAIPKRILSKNERLDDDEYRKIKKHPHIGYLITKYILHMKDEACIIRKHHERIDGKGYPFGLKSAEIDELSKIISICDAFDAMTTNRVYRKKSNLHDALVELSAHAGTQFDKTILLNFFKYINSKFNTINVFKKG